MRTLFILFLLYQGISFGQSLSVEHLHVRRYHGLTFGFGINNLIPSSESNAIGYSQKFGYEQRIRFKKSAFSLIPQIFYWRDINRAKPRNDMSLNVLQDRVGLEITTELRLIEKLGITTGVFGTYTLNDRIYKRHSRKEEYSVSTYDLKDPNHLNAGVNLGLRYYGEMLTSFLRIDYSGLSYFQSDYFYNDGTGQSNVVFNEGAKNTTIILGVIWAWETGKRRKGCGALVQNPD